MSHVLTFAAFSILVVWLTFVFYLAIMHLIPHKESLSMPAKILAYPALYAGFVLDFILNVVVATVLFLDFPREALFTHRLKRYLYGMDTPRWREDLAAWFCSKLLNQFDPSGKHC